LCGDPVNARVKLLRIVSYLEALEVAMRLDGDLEYHHHVLHAIEELTALMGELD